MQHFAQIALEKSTHFHTRLQQLLQTKRHNTLHKELTNTFTTNFAKHVAQIDKLYTTLQHITQLHTTLEHFFQTHTTKKDCLQYYTQKAVHMLENSAILHNILQNYAQL